jgi:hypothetical protein
LEDSKGEKQLGEEQEDMLYRHENIASGSMTMVAQVGKNMYRRRIWKEVELAGR